MWASIAPLTQEYQGGIWPYAAADCPEDVSVCVETAETTLAGVQFGCKFYSQIS